METFVRFKSLVDNPGFREHRLEALAQLEVASIDAPMVDLIDGFKKLPYCFTLQSCYGHFLHGGHLDRGNLELLPLSESNAVVEYRIAYVALCVDNCDDGVSFLGDLQELTNIDPEYVQFGCANWFWRRQVNSYALQVEPERLKTRDRVRIGYQEALRVQRIRTACYARLGELLDLRLRDL